MEDIKAIDIMNWPTQIEGLNYDYNGWEEWRIMAKTTFKSMFPTGRFPFTEQERAQYKFLYGTVFYPYEDVPTFVNQMDKDGYEIVCISALRMWSYRYSRSLITDYREEHIKGLADTSNGRIIGVAGYNPFEIEASLAQIKKSVEEYGFKFVFAHPITFGLPFNDKKMYPLYALASQLKIPVSMQVGHSAEPLPSWVGHPITVDEVVLDFPDLTLNLSHTGYPWIEEFCDMLWKHPNVYGDIAAYMPSNLDPKLLDFINSGVGRQKVMWGSNGFGLARGKKEILAMNWKDETKVNILRNNACRFLGMPEKIMKIEK